MHTWLETASDKKLRAIYTMVEEDAEQAAVEYTDEYKHELERRLAAYQNGSEAALTARESRERIDKLMNAIRKG